MGRERRVGRECRVGRERRVGRECRVGRAERAPPSCWAYGGARSARTTPYTPQRLNPQSAMTHSSPFLSTCFGKGWYCVAKEPIAILAIIFLPCKKCPVHRRRPQGSEKPRNRRIFPLWKRVGTPSAVLYDRHRAGRAHYYEVGAARNRTLWYAKCLNELGVNRSLAGPCRRMFCEPGASCGCLKLRPP